MVDPVDLGGSTGTNQPDPSAPTLDPPETTGDDPETTDNPDDHDPDLPPGSTSGDPQGESSGGSDGSSGGSTGEGCTSDCTEVLELITDGGFDDDLDAWVTENNPVGSLDTDVVYEVVDGIVSPGWANAPAGRVLYQDIEVPLGITSATFSMVFGTSALGDVDPENVPFIEADFYDERPGAQDAGRIDFVDPEDEVFYASILHEVWLPPATFGNFSNPSDVVTVDVTDFLQDHEGETVRLRFGHVETNIVIFSGIDDVSIEVEAEVDA